MYFIGFLNTGGLRENLREMDGYGAYTMNDVFAEASSKEDVFRAVTEVDGDCAQHVFIDELKLGEKQKFRAGDPIEFEGVAEIVNNNLGERLKITITGNVSIYFGVRSDCDDRKFCNFLELAE